MAEKAIFTARAVVYYFDSAKRSWAPTPVGQDFCRVDMYENTSNNTFRVIGRGLKDTSKVVINSNVTKDTQYTRASETFHQWSDSRYIYGLNFGSKEEAETFGTGFEGIVQRLKAATGGAPSAPAPLAPQAPQVQVKQAAPAAPKAPEAPPAPPAAPKAPEAPPAPPAAPKAPEAPPAPPGAPPPPPAPKVSAAAPERGALLGSITSFNKNGLKKAVTVDKSAPIVKEEKNTSGGGGGGGMMAEILAKRGKMTSASPGGGGAPKKASPLVPPSNPISPAKSNNEPASSRASFKKVVSAVQVPSPGGPAPSGPISPPVKLSSSGSVPNESNASDLSAIKEEILAEMRRELQLMKEEILSAIQNR